MNTNYPNDNLTGYNFQLLETNVVKHTFGLQSLRERLKLFKPSGVTDGQIDELVDFYVNLP
jgi:hypothetical protein